MSPYAESYCRVFQGGGAMSEEPLYLTPTVRNPRSS